MKATTLWQPYATLVALGIKTIETRSYAPPAALIGQRIAIHAAKRVCRYGEIDPETERVMRELHNDSMTTWRKAIETGAVVATARLVDAAQRLSLSGTTRLADG